MKLFQSHDEGEKIFLLCEPCEQGSLTSYLANGNFSQTEIRFMMKQAADGIKYIHSKGVVHRDLKPDNIGVNREGTLKLLDFGLARKLQIIKYEGWFGTQTIVEELENFCGTEMFFSPEIIARKKYDAKSADTWALGFIFYWMAYQRYPHGAHKQVKFTSESQEFKLIFRF